MIFIFNNKININKGRRCIIIIRIKKIDYDNSYIVFDDSDFKNHHTHTPSYEIAAVIRNNIVYKRLPKSNNIRLLESHLRVSNDEEYNNLIKKKVNEIKYKRKGKGTLRYKSHNCIKSIVELKMNRDKSSGKSKYNPITIRRIYQLIYKLDKNQPNKIYSSNNGLIILEFLNEKTKDIYKIQIDYDGQLRIVSNIDKNEYEFFYNKLNVKRMYKEINSFLYRKCGG